MYAGTCHDYRTDAASSLRPQWLVLLLCVAGALLALTETRRTAATVLVAATLAACVLATPAMAVTQGEMTTYVQALRDHYVQLARNGLLAPEYQNFLDRNTTYTTTPLTGSERADAIAERLRSFFTEKEEAALALAAKVADLYRQAASVPGYNTIARPSYIDVDDIVDLTRRNVSKGV